MCVGRSHVRAWGMQLDSLSWLPQPHRGPPVPWEGLPALPLSAPLSHMLSDCNSVFHDKQKLCLILQMTSSGRLLFS